MEFFHKNEYVRSYSVYKHDTTLKMTFGAFFFLDFNAGPPIVAAPWPRPPTSIDRRDVVDDGRDRAGCERRRLGGRRAVGAEDDRR